MDRQEVGSMRAGSPEFDSTRWSLVLAAGQSASVDARSALEELCQLYWYPLYAYVRRRGYATEEAQDLTQEFFARLLQTDAIQVADPERGKFRSFLLGSLRNFVNNEWDKRTARKRGGGQVVMQLDFSVGEARYSREPSHEETAERLFERQWAVALLDRVMQQLADEQHRGGKAQQFEQLKLFIAGRNPQVRYADAARALGMSEQGAMQAASRLRRRYRALLKMEIAQTVSTAAAIEEEHRALFEVLSS